MLRIKVDRIEPIPQLNQYHIIVKWRKNLQTGSYSFVSTVLDAEFILGVIKTAIEEELQRREIERLNKLTLQKGLDRLLRRR